MVDRAQSLEALRALEVPSSAPPSSGHGRLLRVVLGLAVIKLAVVWLALGALPESAWARQLGSEMDGWAAFFTQVRAGGVPYVDVPCRLPVLAGSLYWLLARACAFLQLEGRSVLLVHATVMALVDLLNALLLYRLAQRVNPGSALRALIVVALSATALLLGPLRHDAWLVTFLLLGLELHQTGRPTRASLVWSIGAGIHWFVLLPLVLVELRTFSVERDRSSWLRTLALIGAVQLTLHAPFVLGAWLQHADLAAALVQFGPQPAVHTPHSTFGLIEAWLGWTVQYRIGPYVLLGCLAYVCARRLADPLVYKLAVLAIVASVFDFEAPARFQLCLYPLVLWIALQASQQRQSWLCALYLAIDLATVVGFPWLFSLAQLEPAEHGAVWTLLWSTVFALRLLLLGALARDLARGPESLAEAPGPLRWPRLDRARWTAWLRTPRTLVVVAFILIGVQAAVASQASVGMSRYSDENAHLRQIRRYCRGQHSLHETITMLPGYHVLSAVLAKATGDCSVTHVRRLQVWWGLLATTFAFLIVTSLGSQRAASRTLGLHFLPILYPHLFVVYTDIAALAFGLLAVWLLVRERWTAASLVATASILVRQTNLLFLLLIAFVTLLEHDKSKALRQWVRDYCKQQWACLLGLAAFASFVLVNGGVAVGDRGAHQAGLHIGNLVFALIVLGIASLPVTLERIWRQREQLATPAFGVALLAFYLVYMRLFVLEHPYNTDMEFLRNAALMWSTSSPLKKTLFFAPVAFGFCAVWLTPFVRKSYWVVLPISLLALLPEALVELRYGIVPISLWMLLRRDGSALAEGLTAVLNFMLATLCLYWVVTRIWSL